MTNSQVIDRLDYLVPQERRITREILELIHEVETRKIYLDKYDSIYTWLIAEYKYSEGAAARRINASRLHAVVDCGAQIESGALNLTNLGKAHRVFKVEEKRTGVKLDSVVKSQVVAKLENKSGEAADRALYEIFPEAQPKSKPEHFVATGNGDSLITLRLDTVARCDFARAREILSHALPDASLSEVFARVVGDFVKRKDPLLKTQRKAHDGKLSEAKKRTVIRRDNGQCTYELATGKLCGSRHRIEVDHIVPRALGGTDHVDNLRCLCRNHNQRAAEEKLGQAWASSWREDRPN